MIFLAELAFKSDRLLVQKKKLLNYQKNIMHIMQAGNLEVFLVI